MRRCIAVLILLSACSAIAHAQGQRPSVDCLDTTSALEYWRQVRVAVQEGNADAEALALPLLGCLGSPNSELRDRIGYEVLTFWLRSNALSAATQREMLSTLRSNLAFANADDSLLRSFSALILSELVRADNITPIMSDAERLGLLQVSVAALERETDYRGLTSDVGWVHPVAHLADLLWRFALHSSLTTQQAELILQGVRSQAGTSRTSFAFNESDRLARSVATLITRQSLSQSELLEWLSSFDTPASADDWFSAFASIEGMQELHNSKAFVRALSDQLLDQEIGQEVRAKIDSLVELFTSIV